METPQSQKGDKGSPGEKGTAGDTIKGETDHEAIQVKKDAQDAKEDPGTLVGEVATAPNPQTAP